MVNTKMIKIKHKTCFFPATSNGVISDVRKKMIIDLFEPCILNVA